MNIEFRVLGPLEVLVEGRALELKRRKQRSLLALLLLRAGEVVSTDQLVDELWAGKPPKAAVGSLQNLVSELRKVIGREAVLTREPGYVLEVAPEHIDLHRFERLVAQAAEGGDASRRSSLLQEALAMWRGPPLADLAYEPFAQVEVARLEELRTAAREEFVDAKLELGHHSQLVGELESLVAENPLRERLRGQLMLALYRSGRQAEALEAYRQARETLLDELGLEPSEELQRLEQAILRHDRELDLRLGVTEAEAPSGEERRKTVTVLFTEIVDSATLNAALDPEVLRGVMRRYFDTVRSIVERHGGTVEKFIGDAAMAVFGVPQIHEDDALRAVRAADDLRAALAGLNEELERDHALALQIRIGINTGEVLAGDAASGEPFATGAAVTIAIRLQQASLPGETLLGEQTRALLRDAVTSEPVERIEAGALGSIQAFRLTDVAEGARTRPQARVPFVGRREELATLAAAFESVREQRRSRVVAVLGDAGVGKTRLAAEFGSSLGDKAKVLVGRCVSYGEGATYLPLSEVVRQVAPSRPEATIAGLLRGDQHASLIAQRMVELTTAEGSPPTGELFWAVRRFLEALAAERPVLLVLEDIHWAEPTLLDLIEYLGAWISEAPVLVLVIARPELLDQRPGWRSTSETISLTPLSVAESDALLSELAGDAVVPEETRARILDVAEGNALFVEQLLAYVTEDVGPERLAEAVPPSIEALLASRLDALDEEVRAVLERAAVVGKDFARTAVLHLSPPDSLAVLDARLTTLERKGLIHRQRAGPAHEDGFRFHHVLIRDVAYAGITKERRADLHERHGTWLDSRNDPDELVGYHAEQAHKYRSELRPSDPDLGRLASWAGERLAAAGIRAWKRADTPATVNLLGRATALLSPGSDERVELLCELGMAQKWAGEFDRGEATLVEASDAARDQRMKLWAQIELAHLRLFRDPEGASAELLALAAKAVPLFEELNDDRALGRTWRHVGYVRGTEGRLGDWQEAVERALVYYRRAGWSVSGCLADLASALLYGPTPALEALDRCEELLEEATDLAGRANILAFMSGLEAIDGRFDDARHHVAEAARTYEEIGEVYAGANYSGRVLGRIEMLAGDPGAAARVLEGCCATLERMHDASGLSTVAAELADALYVQTRYEEAESWLELAQKHAASEDVSAQWSWRRTRAKVLARAGAFSEGEAIAGEAVRIASRTDALSDHGFVLLDLAEVLRLADRPGEAAEHVEVALLLFKRKGNRVSAEAAGALLNELTVA